MIHSVIYFVIALNAVTWHGKDVLWWDDFSFSMDSLVGCGSLCCKVSLFPSLPNFECAYSFVAFLMLFESVTLPGRFFMMGLKIELKLAILFPFAFFFVPLEFLLMSSPKQWQKELEVLVISCQHWCILKLDYDCKWITISKYYQNHTSMLFLDQRYFILFALTISSQVILPAFGFTWLQYDW